MKLNKITMDYIRKLVNEKAKAKKDKLVATRNTLVKEREDFIEKFNNEIEKLRKETEKKADTIGKKYDMPHDTTWGGVTYDVSVNICHFATQNHSLNKKEIEKADAEVARLNELVEATTNEVIAKLSLGGDLADLERMLAEIKF